MHHVYNAYSLLFEFLNKGLKPIWASSKYSIYTKLITRCIVQYTALYSLGVLHSIFLNYQHLF